MSQFRKWAHEEIEAGRSPAGGFGKVELAVFGVRWPPKKGWYQALLRGEDPNNPQSAYAPSSEVSDLSDSDLLQRVVMAVINSGHAEILHEVPGLLDRYKARVPE